MAGQNAKSSREQLKELLETDEFHDPKSQLTMALGKDIAGNTLLTDLAAMPHMMIAGTTGSGKTVCVNSLIMSILFQASPEEVKIPAPIMLAITRFVTGNSPSFLSSFFSDDPFCMKSFFL